MINYSITYKREGNMGVMRVNKINPRNRRTGLRLRASLALAVAVGAAFFAGLTSPAHALNPIMHNSSTMGSNKWPGGWGNSTGSKYGKFTCNTCHTAGTATGNSKQIRSTVTSPNAPTDNFPAGGTVTFNSWSTFGNPVNPPRATSTRVCEVCHTQTTYHKYNGGSSHYDDSTVTDKDCATANCHPHSTGFKPVGGCTNCHGYPPTASTYGGPSGLATQGAYGGNTNFLPATQTGTHTRHSTQLAMTCNACHNGYTGSPMGNGRLELGITVNSTTWPQYNGTAVSYGTYTGNSDKGALYNYSGVNGTRIGGLAATKNTCNVYCHGNWSGSGRTLRPDWIGTGTVTCGTCHGTTTAAAPTRASHPKHASNGTTSYAISCTTCHPKRLTGDTTHITGSVQWRLSTGSVKVPVGATYNGSATNSTGTPAPSASYASCNGIYCHSYKASDVRTNVSVQWGTTLAADCTGCHPNDASATTKMTADAHKAHINNASVRFSGMKFKCSECHWTTVNSTDNRTLVSGAYGASGTHVNGTATVAWGTINTGSPNYAAGNTCGSSGQTTYCHSDGAGGLPKVTPTAWNGVADSAEGNAGCNYCHGGLKADNPNHIATKKHARHIGVGVNVPHADIPCYQCHRRTATVGNAILTNTTGLHLNKVKNVSMSNNFNGVLANYTGLYRVGSDDCANTYCHGNQVTPAWGSVQTRACGDCHGTSNSGLLSAPHAKHYNTATNVTASNGWTNTKNGSGTTYVFYCGTCHNVGSANHVNGPPTAGKGDSQLAILPPGDQTNFSSSATQSSTSVTGDSRNYRYSASTTCSVYCHGNAYAGGPVYRSTRAWSGSAACGSCHTTSANKQFTDWSPGHTRHIGSNATLRQYSSNTNFRCGTCHNATITNGTNAAIIGTTKNHVNGYRNISSNTWAGSGTAPLRWNSGTYTCTLSYCHSSGRTTTVQYNTTPSWRSGSVTCLSCHGGRNGATYSASSAGFKLSTTHSQHLGKYPAANMNCQICHAKTATDAANLKNYTGVKYHVNKTKDVRFTDVAYGSYTSYKTGTKKCGNVSCHGGTSRNAWSENGALNNDNTCVHCHGTAGTAAGIANSGDNRKFFAPGWPKNSAGTYNPGIDTDGDKTRTNYQVGAHFAHLSSVVMKKIRCNECHIVPSTPFDGGHMAQPRFTLSQTLRFDQASSAKWNDTNDTTLSSFTGYTSGTATKAATCSSVYCHGYRLKNGTSNGTYRKPYWSYSGMTRTGTQTVICGRCHGIPPDQVSGSHSGKTINNCVDCHPAVVNSSGVIINKALHINRSIEAVGGDCLGCHNSTQTKTKGTAGTIRTIVGASGDFVRLSRHVSNGTATQIVTKWDCIVCHREGNKDSGTGSTDTALHGNDADSTGLVHLRNVDNPSTGWAINNKSGQMTETMRVDTDNFCLSCHDSDGAAGINVNGSNTGLNQNNTRALTPWNTLDNRRNGRDGMTTRTRVIDVKSQFNPGTYLWNGTSTAMPTGFTASNYDGNASQHNVMGPRYYGNNASWTTATWVNHTNRANQVMNGATIRERARLHCSDCHLNETNAHGATNAWHMLLDGVANNYTNDTIMTGAALGSALVCYKCHAQGVYSAASSTATRSSHKTDSHWDDAGYGDTAGGAPNLGPQCLQCHSGDGFGRIHGRGSATDSDNGTYTPTGGSGTYTKQRFIPGGWMEWKPGTGGTDSDWNSTTTGTCYFRGNTQWSNCNTHSSGLTGQTVNYARPIKY